MEQSKQPDYGAVPDGGEPEGSEAAELMDNDGGVAQHRHHHLSPSQERRVRAIVEEELGRHDLR